MRPALRICLALVSVMLLAGVRTDPAAKDGSAWLGDGSIRLVGISPGMLFTADGLGVVVPPPGAQVGAEAILQNGSTVTFSVETTQDGSVFLHREAAFQAVGLYQVEGGDEKPLPEPPTPSALDADGPKLPREVPRVVKETVDRVVNRLGLRPPSDTPKKRPPRGARSGSPSTSVLPSPSPTRVSDTGVQATALGACVDGAYQVAGPKWAKPVNWYLSSGNLPTNLSLTGVESALQRAMNRMVGGYNNCGLADGISATASYAGRTTGAPNVSSSAACLSSDHKTEFGFLSLPTGMVGMACWWSSSGEISEGDVAFNKSTKWYLSKPLTCLSKWSLEAAAAHELGHLFGLNHVSELEHGALTMAPKIMSCQNSEITLGLGDVKGLEALY